ncbi:MAG TPA: thioredoxin [Longimicrobiales bacterium]|nr:thioredoxin [Longimicrobiales bacterium]
MFFRKKPRREAPIVHVDDSDFDTVILEGEGITVVDFWAAWCSPCRMMEPILDEIALEFEDRGVTVAKLDTEQAPETTGRFEIRSIPTLIFFRDGEPLFQLTGLVPKPVLERELGELLEGD